MEKKQQIEISSPKLSQIKVKVKGDRLLMNRQTEEVQEKLKEYFNNKKSRAKEGKVIEESKTEKEIAELKVHKDAKGNVVFPVEGFKKGMVGIASSFGLHQTDIKRNIQIIGDIVPIKFKKQEVHKGMGRTSGMGRTPIPTIRPLFIDWSCELEIRFNATKFTASDVVNLLNHAGFYSGLGDWRPEKNGSYGQYTVTQ